jgi:hypothetical protein
MALRNALKTRVFVGDVFAAIGHVETTAAEAGWLDDGDFHVFWLMMIPIRLDTYSLKS